jgi:2,3-bisphosphoglycerate-dependent phosphoglycerate mutase
MPFLYLIRHPRTHVDPTRPPNEWELSEQGRAQVRVLGAAPFWKSVKVLYSSGQPKALGAAGTIGALHNIPVGSLSGLAEVSRGHEVYHSAGDYDTILGQFFAFPDHAIAGWERGTDALNRFTASVEHIVSQHPDQSIALLSHGTILTLYTAMLDQQPPTLERWRSIAFATVAAVDIDSHKLVTKFISPPYEAVPIA